MKQMVRQRVDAMRDAMRRRGIHAFILPSSDPHCGEYVPAHWQSREWISGFNGSAGTAVVTLEDAALWTDSRYFLAAADQLASTPFSLMREARPETPTIAQWLSQTLEAGSVVAADGWVWDYGTLLDIKEELEAAGLVLRTDIDLVEELWTDRPSLPLNAVEVQPLEFAGESASDKLGRIRESMAEAGADHLLLCALDDVAWTCNIRSTDVHCTPMAVAYLLVGCTDAVLYIDHRKLTEAVADHLMSEGIRTAPYEDIRNVSGAGERFLLSNATCNYALVDSLVAAGVTIIDDNPVSLMKAVKNETEIEGFRRAMRRDGVAMVRFCRWLSERMEAGELDTITELTVDERLTAERAAQEHFRGLSFDTIAAYGPHGAIVHYEATPETASRLEPHGLLLLDSGAQYRDGTTDITRTIPLGPLTPQECHDYTLVLKGHIALATQRFPEGVAGTRIDAFARYALWQEGMDYGHGTGHGVGSYLSVHEGPQGVRHTWKPAGLVPGMTMTNEPGIYREGCHGVRIENTMLVVADGETDFGRFCHLEALTLCPIDRAPILLSLLTTAEIAYIDAYHARVWTELSPLLDGKDKAWLRQATLPLTP
ncbi:MAG: aminopeptidase P family protein [Bacteroidaceae bacterium]|nr:aminopeptidase P family protein [Bacteroidaceae bacterium]